MKKIISVFLLVAISIVNAQVGLGTTSPDPSAVLDVSSSTSGFLPPRMTGIERNAISAPVTGLLIHCTDCGMSGGQPQFYNGTVWVNMIGTSAFAATSSPVLSELYQGGIVAYVFQPGDPGYDANVPHGIIVTTTDVATASWGCMNTLISGANGTALGTGLQNTIDIEAGCTTGGTAATICANYTNIDSGTGTYSDWFLPSKDELNKLYGLKVLGFGNFNATNYWSSTEYEDGYGSGGGFAWNQDFSVGTQISGNGKANGFNVRAVRYF